MFSPAPVSVKACPFFLPQRRPVKRLNVSRVSCKEIEIHSTRSSRSFNLYQFLSRLFHFGLHLYLFFCLCPDLSLKFSVHVGKLWSSAWIIEIFRECWPAYFRKHSIWKKNKKITKHININLFVQLTKNIPQNRHHM